MIDRAEILAASTDLGLEPRVVEKDYVLGWLLAGIYAHEALAPAWVFKGGTCLKKCFFETYRFSEDLDLTLTEEAHLEEGFLRGAFADVAAWATPIAMCPRVASSRAATPMKRSSRRRSGRSANARVPETCTTW